MFIGGYNPFHNYFCLAYSCCFSFYLLETQKFLVEIARWLRFEYKISRALVSYWHPPKLVLPTRFHSNTCSSLLSIFLLPPRDLGTPFSCRRLSSGGPSRGTLLVMESSTSSHIPEIAVRQRACDELHLLYSHAIPK